jgi:hypothetical protein
LRKDYSVHLYPESPFLISENADGVGSALFDTEVIFLSVAQRTVAGRRLWSCLSCDGEMRKRPSESRPAGLSSSSKIRIVSNVGSAMAR